MTQLRPLSGKPTPHHECAYGENPYQAPAALHQSSWGTYPLAPSRFRLIDGRKPSYINWTDVGRVTRTIVRIAAGYARNFQAVPHIAVAVKHGNACGVGMGDHPVIALRRMVMGDPESVFGSVVMTNFPVTDELAWVLRRHGIEEGAPPRLFDGICAPEIHPAACGIVARRDGKYFIAVNPALSDLSEDSLDRTRAVRQLPGGDFLVQPANRFVLDLSKADVTGELSRGQGDDLVVASAICATSDSNTITLVRSGQLLANAVGQQSRVLCCRLAVMKAEMFGHNLEGASAASDSFFPFPDGPEVLAGAGVRAIQTTFGSRNDALVRETCERLGVTLVWLPDTEGRVFDGH